MKKLKLTDSFAVVDPKGNESSETLKDILSTAPQTLLYVYSMDNSKGCTIENVDFTEHLSDFKKLDIVPVGVSKNSVAAHQKFIAEHKLKTDLISDPDLKLIKELGAYGEKNNYGKKSMGVIRSTFLVDEDGEILESWKNVKATGHVERVLAQLQEQASKK